MVGILAVLAMADQGQILYRDSFERNLPPYIRALQVQTQAPGSRISEADPLFMIQAVNSFVPLGQAKALSTMENLDGYIGEVEVIFGNYWPFWLTRILFWPKDATYQFPHFDHGQVGEILPDHVEKWPTFPLFVVGDIPFCFRIAGSGIRGGGGGGGDDERGPFADYLGKNKDFWTMRTKPLHPPDDPFPVLKELLKPGVSPLSAAETRDAGIAQILELVRTCYRPSGRNAIQKAQEDAAVFERYHQEFLQKQCRWDQKRNLYVRKDGTFDKDPMAETYQIGYRFPAQKGVKITVNFRLDERDVLTWSVDCFEEKGRMVPAAVVVARNVTKGKEADWLVGNVPSWHLGSAATRDDLLKMPPHPADSFAMRVASHCPIAYDDRFVFDLYYNGKVISSPPLKPW